MNRQILEAIKLIHIHTHKLNYGGCGVFALAFYEFLLQQGYENVHIIYLFDDVFSDSRLNNIHAIENNNPKLLDGCMHAVVKWNTKYYDSSGEYDSICDLLENCGVLQWLELEHSLWTEKHLEGMAINITEYFQPVQLFHHLGDATCWRQDADFEGLVQNLKRYLGIDYSKKIIFEKIEVLKSFNAQHLF